MLSLCIAPDYSFLFYIDASDVNDTDKVGRHKLELRLRHLPPTIINSRVT